jgi:ribosome-binding factor A
LGQEFSRTERVGDFLQQELAKLLLHSIRDPRAEFVSVTAVEVSRDLRHAKVFFTKLGLEDAKSAVEVTRVLDKAAGFLRSEIARESTLRTVPKLTFKFDESVGRGREMEALLGKARVSDAQNRDPSSVDDT